jgi:sigma-B regulation protein RsbU (phosphoserine phosphatase)
MVCRSAKRTLRHLAFTLPLALFVLFAYPIRAQTFDATHLREPANLAMKWLVQAGDNPAYASPDFDDSHWTLFDPSGSIESLFPHHPEVVWYRLHVKVDSTQTGLALSEMKLSRAFEIYVNGERLMASGQVAPFVPYTSDARVLARIPDRVSASGAIVIALRVHISTLEWNVGQDPGLYSDNLTVGQEKTLYRYNWLSIIGENASGWISDGLGVCLGLVALVLFAAQRRQTEYLWIFAVGVMGLVLIPTLVVSQLHNIPIGWMLFSDSIRLVSPYIWASLYFSFVHVRMGWRWRMSLIVIGILYFIGGLHGWFIDLSLPLQTVTNLPFVIFLSVVIPIVLVAHWRRGNREAGILLIPVILFSLYIYALVAMQMLFQIPSWRQFSLRGLNLINRYPVGPFSVSLNSMSGILSVVSLAIIMLQRSSTMSRRQAQLEGELAAAQEVQRVLVPEQTGGVPGFAVESVYEPAQQVGGDFFQIVPIGGGGVLIVVGDVAGKGLPAAMLVSVLVGAVRAVVEYTHQPAEILANLNERLVGRSGGAFSTALAAFIAPDGRVTIANAGHLSPYLDGREVELPGALPLGVASAARYETVEFQMNGGSRLTFYSDGVIEAQRPSGELFGFERAREVSMMPAAEIVATAKQFGQEDDITVVTVTRTAAVASAA